MSEQVVVTLNVGGKLFTTTKSTLVNLEPNSMLAAMMNNDKINKELVDGGIFIDRDPTYFAEVLNYLRTGYCKNPTKPLIEEAEYYRLETLLKALSENMIEEAPKSRKRTRSNAFTLIDVDTLLDCADHPVIVIPRNHKLNDPDNYKTMWNVASLGGFEITIVDWESVSSRFTSTSHDIVIHFPKPPEETYVVVEPTFGDSWTMCWNNVLSMLNKHWD